MQQFTSAPTDDAYYCGRVCMNSSQTPSGSVANALAWRTHLRMLIRLGANGPAGAPAATVRQGFPPASRCY